MTIDPSVRTQIVLGAVNAATAKLAALTSQAAGDRDALDRLPDLEALIARSAAEITAAIDPKSAVSRLIDAVHGSKVFTAVITEVVRGAVLHPRPGHPADPAQPVPPGRRRAGPHRTHRQPRRPADGPHPARPHRAPGRPLDRGADHRQRRPQGQGHPARQGPRPGRRRPRHRGSRLTRRGDRSVQRMPAGRTGRR